MKPAVGGRTCNSDDKRICNMHACTHMHGAHTHTHTHTHTNRGTEEERKQLLRLAREAYLSHLKEFRRH